MRRSSFKGKTKWEKHCVEKPNHGEVKHALQGIISGKTSGLTGAFSTHFAEIELFELYLQILEFEGNEQCKKVEKTINTEEKGIEFRENRERLFLVELFPSPLSKWSFAVWFACLYVGLRFVGKKC